MRPLNESTEYATLAGSVNPADNVLISANTNVTANQTVNALVLATPSGSAVTSSGSAAITVTSGMVLFNQSGFPTDTVNLEFGSTTGILDVGQGGLETFNGTIDGTGGVIFTGGSLEQLGNNNTYTGRTTILSGTATMVGDVPVNAPSAFGDSADPIVLDPGASGAAIQGGVTASNPVPAHVTLSRNVIVNGNGSGSAILEGNAFSNTSLTMNGTITLNRQLNTSFGSATPFIDNGLIQGSGRLAIAGGAILNHANTYSSGTELTNGAVVYVSDNSAFGTGTIWGDSTTATGGNTIAPHSARRELSQIHW